MDLIEKDNRMMFYTMTEYVLSSTKKCLDNNKCVQCVQPKPELTTK